MIVPSPLFFISCHIGTKDSTVLFPEELTLLEGASNKRQREFCAGRYCAHNLLEILGYANQPILKDKCGAPIWPEGITGSISHSGNVAVAIASAHGVIRSVGIDIQKRLKPFPFNIIHKLYRAEEMGAFLKIPSISLDLYSYSVFSAKESVFKCCYMVFDYFLSFSDIVIELDLEKGVFMATTPDLPHWKVSSFCHGINGRVYFDLEYVYSIIWLDT